MQDLIKKYPGMDYVPLDGFKPKTVPVEEGMNTDLLVTGNLTTIIDHQLIAQ
ncbi:hypothetical protein RUND412_011212 [Rhizina undulata]